LIESDVSVFPPVTGMRRVWACLETGYCVSRDRAERSPLPRLDHCVAPPVRSNRRPPNFSRLTFSRHLEYIPPHHSPLSPYSPLHLTPPFPLSPPPLPSVALILTLPPPASPPHSPSHLARMVSAPTTEGNPHAGQCWRGVDGHSASVRPRRRLSPSCAHNHRAQYDLYPDLAAFLGRWQFVIGAHPLWRAAR